MVYGRAGGIIVIGYLSPACISQTIAGIEVVKKQVSSYITTLYLVY